MLLAKKISNLMHCFKSHGCHLGNFSMAISILLNHWENANEKKFPYRVPGSAQSKIYAGKSTKGGLSKKALTGSEKSVLF